MIKRLPSSLLVIPFAASLAFAQQPPQPPPPDPTRPPTQTAPETTKPAGGSMEVPADVVTANTEAKTITVTVLIRNETGGQPSPKEVTIPVDAEALPTLQTVNPGDKVKLLCRMNDTGKVAAVKGIEKSKSDPQTP